MAKKARLSDGYRTGFAPNYESDGSGSSGRVDTEITASRAPWRKCITLNPVFHCGFQVFKQVVPLSKLSTSDKKDLVIDFRAELEQIRNLRKRAELQRKNIVTASSSSDILSCSNAQNRPPVGKTKKSSELNCGPGKIFNPESQKGSVLNRNTSGRFQSTTQTAAGPSTSDAILFKQCESLLKKLMQHQHSWAFNTPVDAVKLNLPDYLTIIKHPMDLGTIKRKITSCEYSSPRDFLADVRLTFSNAMTYNPPGNDFYLMADTLSKFFEVRWKVIEKKLPVNKPQKLPVESDIVKPMPPSKKRKIASIEHKVIQEPLRRKMSDEEKSILGRQLEESLEDSPGKIIDFLREQSSNKDSGDDEIEIVIDDLSDDTLFALRKLLDEHLQEKQNLSKAEPCEIELLNESGVSNSSMQLDKGNDIVDKDVDMGGNDPPVSSYPPVKTEKNKARKSNKPITSDFRSSSGSKSDVGKASRPVKREHSDVGADLDENAVVGDLNDGNQSVSGLDQLEQFSLRKTNSFETLQDEDSAPKERVSPDKLYRAAVLKNRFADTILKAREKTIRQGEKGDPEKLRREREELELQKRKERARLQAEAKAAEDARRRAEAEIAAEAKRKRELDREAARQELLKMEKTVEINENAQILQDLEMLRTVPLDQLPSSVDETSPDHSQDCLGSFKFGGSNPLEQLGLFMKDEEDDEEEEDDLPSSAPHAIDDVEEGEID